jgi:hypothetical protein
MGIWVPKAPFEIQVPDKLIDKYKYNITYRWGEGQRQHDEAYGSYNDSQF